MAIPGPNIPGLPMLAGPLMPQTRAHPDAYTLGMLTPPGDESEDERLSILRSLLSPPSSNMEGQDVGGGMMLSSPKTPEEFQQRKASFIEMFKNLQQYPEMQQMLLQIAGAILQPAKSGAEVVGNIGQGIVSGAGAFADEQARQRRLEIADKREARDAKRDERDTQSALLDLQIKRERIKRFPDEAKIRELELQLAERRAAIASGTSVDEEIEARRAEIGARTRTADAVPTAASRAEERRMAMEEAELRLQVLRDEAQDAPDALAYKQEMRDLEKQLKELRIETVQESLTLAKADPEKLVNQLISDRLGKPLSELSAEEIITEKAKIKVELASSGAAQKFKQQIILAAIRGYGQNPGLENIAEGYDIGKILTTAEGAVTDQDIQGALDSLIKAATGSSAGTTPAAGEATVEEEDYNTIIRQTYKIPK